MRAFVSILLFAWQACAASTAIATSPIVTVYESTSYSVRSSVTGSSTSTSQGEPSCTTYVDGSTACVGGGIAISIVTLYGSSTSTIISQITSTIGYSTIYSSVPDPSVSLPSTTTSASDGATTPTTASLPSSISGVSSPGQSVTSLSSASQTASSGSSSRSASGSSSSSSSSSTTPAANDASQSASSSNLSTGLKAAIAVAVILGVVLGAIAAVFFIRRHRKRKAVKSPEVSDVVGSAFGKAELGGHESVLSATKAPATSVQEDASYGNTHGVYNQAYEVPGHSSRYEAYGTARHEMGEGTRMNHAHELEGTTWRS